MRLLAPLLLASGASSDEAPPASGCPPFARDVLVDLYNSATSCLPTPTHPCTPNPSARTMSGTGGDVSWRKADGWLSSLPCCDWFGVTCAEGSGELVKLRLADNDLHGTLPESLGLLADLRELIIYGNSPGRGQTCEDPEVGCLTGTIPPNLGGLQKLEQLYLHYNRLSGTVPSLRGMAPSLRFIHIGGNVASRDCADPCGGLSGGLDWLAELTSLEEVLLWENRFSGPFPWAMEGLQRLVRSHDH